ncbi:MAG TPA: peptidoglycan DD-metalloendopeptidase family protein [Rhodanobacteraceae bacterium]|nr:peptidoglycan DD-metalloendopeptidase family protein [Rhodanobacteraceae bacterium]
MHIPISRWRQCLATVALCASMSFTGIARADEPPATSAGDAHAEREAAAKARLAEVRAEIARIAETQKATASQRDAITAKLAEQAGQLNQIANALRDTEAAIAARSASLADLEQQRTQLEDKLSGQRAALADLLRAAYTLDRSSDLSLLLGDDDIARIDRALAYSRYFQHDRVARIRTLLGQVAQLDQVKASIQSETDALKQQRDQRNAQSMQLEQARVAQRKLLAEADAQLARQTNRIAALQRDAEALDKLLKQLQNVFADIPAQLGKNTPFAQLRGKLVWPVAGTPHNGTGTLAQGIVIAAKPGAEVHAVAYGRVAWANFMRGYGMLVIIDQGDGWMSLYGGNEAALVEAGDWVKPGQPLATVGRDPEQGGAWFGLRRDGKPVDPHGWFAK